MKKISPEDFTGKHAWDALDIESIDNATVRLHWTDKPYKWHVNDGPEVFVVLDGVVDMHVRKMGWKKFYNFQKVKYFTQRVVTSMLLARKEQCAF